MLIHGYLRNGKKPTEYHIWEMMKQRCLNPKNEAYIYYGGRGITVCERWLKFVNFIADMKARPSLKHSLERLDNNKGYEPDNCVWANKFTQARNKRNNHLVTAHGETLCVQEWADRAGIDGYTLRWRLKRMSPEEAVSAERRSNVNKTHCKNGHAFSPENTYIKRIGGTSGRECRACASAYKAEWQRNKRASIKANKHKAVAEGKVA